MFTIGEAFQKKKMFEKSIIFQKRSQDIKYSLVHVKKIAKIANFKKYYFKKKFEILV